MLLNPYRFGPPPALSYSRWRILISGSVHAAHVTVAELSIRATPGGANQCTGGTPITGGSYGSPYDESKAFDGNNATMWAKTGVDGAWLGYLFAAPVECVQIAITADNGSFIGHAEPRDFSIQYSPDGITWTTSWTVSGYYTWAYGETRLFTKP